VEPPPAFIFNKLDNNPTKNNTKKLNI